MMQAETQSPSASQFRTFWSVSPQEFEASEAQYFFCVDLFYHGGSE